MSGFLVTRSPGKSKNREMYNRHFGKKIQPKSENDV